MKKIPKSGLLLTAMISAAAVQAADYPTTVAGLHPVGYYRLGETTPNISNIASNSGTIGALGGGVYINDDGSLHPFAQIAPGTGNGSINVQNVAPIKFVQVPLNSANNVKGPFTAECWTVPDASLGNTLYALMTQGHLQNPGNAPNRSGWLLYVDGTGTSSGGNVFDYRMYNHDLINRSLTINGGGTPILGSHVYHVVVGYDGTNGFMYVDGNLVTSAPSPGFFQGTDGQFTIGTRNDLAFVFAGQISDVAYYTNALSASDVLTHYQLGTNSATAPGVYSASVLSKKPIIYYTFNEPTFQPASPLHTSVNLGTWGNNQDAVLQPNVVPGVDGPSYGGFPAGNKAAYLNGLSSASANENAIFVPNPPLNSANVTFTAWIKRNGPSEDAQGHFNGDFAGIIFERGINGGTFPATGLCFGGQATTPLPNNELRYHWNNAQFGYSSGLIVPDQVWSFVAGTFTASNTILCLNGVFATNNVANGPLDFSIDNLFIGADVTGNRIMDASVDEVAIFDYSLTPEQLTTLFASASMPPIITVQPSPATTTLYEGQSVSYTATAIGPNPITYQWQKNGVAISGQTTTALNFTNLKATNSGNYTIKVTNPFTSVTSSVATLTVLAGPPIITKVPSPVSRYADGNATFTVTALGSTPISYQWNLGGTPIAGATKSTFTVTQIQNADIGNYSVTVSNPNGSTNSPAAALTMLPLSPTYVPAVLSRGPFAYWRLNETTGSVALDSVGGLDGTFLPATTKSGLVGPKTTAAAPSPAFPGLESTNTAFAFDGNTSDIAGGNPAITVNALTISCFLKTIGLPNNNNGGACGVVACGNTTLGLYLSGQDASGNGGNTLGFYWAGTFHDTLMLPASNVWTFVTLVISTNNAIMYMDPGDGSGLVNVETPGTYAPATLNAAIHLGRDPAGNRQFQGGLDEVALYSRALTAADVQALHDAAYANTYTPVPPAITLDPVGASLAGGDSITLTAGYSGSVPLSFQWIKNGAPIPGAIRQSLTLANVTPPDAGIYAFVVTQGSTSVTSAPAAVNIQAIIISGQPVGTGLLAGDTYSMSVTARGANLTYQWLKNGNPISGANSATLTLANAQSTDGGSYSVVITSGIYTLTSATALVTVQPNLGYAFLTNKLVLHLKFDGSYSDTSGHGNDAFVDSAHSGGTPGFVSTGQVGQAVHIDNNNYLTVPDVHGDFVFDENTDWSISLWLRYTTDFTDLPVIGTAANSTYQFGWTFTEDQNKFEASICDVTHINGSAIYLQDPIGGPTINNNAWHNLVYTIDRTNGVSSAYIDGKFITSKSIVGLGTLANGNDIFIGQDPTGAYATAGQFDLDDVAIWRRVLDRASSESVYFAGVAGRSIDVAGPTPVGLTINISGSNLVIGFSAGILQSAASLSGPWTDVAGASSPTYTTPLPASGNKYYRVR